MAVLEEIMGLTVKFWFWFYDHEQAHPLKILTDEHKIKQKTSNYFTPPGDARSPSVTILGTVYSKGGPYHCLNVC